MVRTVDFIHTEVKTVTNYLFNVAYMTKVEYCVQFMSPSYQNLNYTD